MKNRKYWITVHHPADRIENHEGVYIPMRKKKSLRDMRNLARELQEKMQPGDLVFIYETKTGNGHYDGKQKIVGLVEVNNANFNPQKTGDGYMKIRNTKWVSEVDCPQENAKRITGLPVGARSPFGHRTNVATLQSHEVIQLLQYVCNSDISDELIGRDFVNETEEEDEPYQRDIRATSPARPKQGPRKAEFVNTTKGRQVKKNPRLAALRFLMSEYKCEVDPTHQPFISRTTKRNFVEAHHLVPARMDVQKEFRSALDHENNIVSLCPNCHRRLHHAISDEKKDTLKYLYKKRKKDLEIAGIHLSMERLISYYE